MIGEVSLYGVYVPWLLLLALLALVASRIVGSLLARFGLYKWIWHPALFDFSLFLILLGGINYFSSLWF